VGISSIFQLRTKRHELLGSGQHIAACDPFALAKPASILQIGVLDFIARAIGAIGPFSFG